jgi:hypothetical protein
VRKRLLKRVAPAAQACRLVIPIVAFLAMEVCTDAAIHDSSTQAGMEQVPTWSAKDMEFFLHGSMSAEVIPESVLRAFIKIYPDLFATSDLTHLGLIPDPEFGWPIGLSRANVKHLGGLPAVGINCASCHFAQITSKSANQPIHVLGATSHFDVEEFFGSILAATFRTSDPANMKNFLRTYLTADPKTFDIAWQSQEQHIVAAMRNDPFGAKECPLANCTRSKMPTCRSHSHHTSILWPARKPCCSFSTISEQRCTFPTNRQTKHRPLPDLGATMRLAF